MESSEPVVVQAIMLSDHVIREAGTNKLTLVGLFSVWNVPTVPFRLPPFWITPFITNFSSGAQEVVVAVRVEQKSSGHVIASAEGKVKFQGGNLPKNLMVELPIPMTAMQVQQAGDLKVVVLVDNEVIGERTFAVNTITGGSFNPPLR